MTFSHSLILKEYLCLCVCVHVCLGYQCAEDTDGKLFLLGDNKIDVPWHYSNLKKLEVLIKFRKGM